MKNVVTISIEGKHQQGDCVLESFVMVHPPLIIYPNTENQGGMVMGNFK